MPTDVMLGDGYVGEVLTRRFPGQYKNPALIDKYPSNEQVVSGNSGGSAAAVGSISPEPQDMADWKGSAFNDWKGSAFSGLGETDEQKQQAAEFYWALKSRGLEIAENLMNTADNLAAIKAQKQQAIDELQYAMQSSVPQPSTDAESTKTIEAYVTAMNIAFQPASERINAIYVGTEDAFYRAAALFGWMEDKWRMNVFPNMENIRSQVGIGAYVDDYAVLLMQRCGKGSPGSLPAEQWVTNVFSAVTNYLQAVAPELIAAKSNAPLRAEEAAKLNQSIDREGLARKFGMTTDQVDQMVVQMGMGEPITLTILLIVAISAAIAASATIAAVYYYNKSVEIAAVGKSQLDKVGRIAQSEIAALRDKADAVIAEVAAEPDANKRAEMADQGIAEVNEQAVQAGANVAVAVEEGKKKIDDAEPGGFGIGTVITVIAVAAVAIGTALALKGK